LCLVDDVSWRLSSLKLSPKFRAVQVMADCASVNVGSLSGDPASKNRRSYGKNRFPNNALFSAEEWWKRLSLNALEITAIAPDFCCVPHQKAVLALGVTSLEDKTIT